VPELRQRFEALEEQFDLPAQPVPVQDLRRAKSDRIKGGKHHHILGILQRVSLQDLAFLGGSAAQPFFGAFDCLLGFPNCT
jgi:hypothetical protein